jgi:hypothetical protein
MRRFYTVFVLFACTLLLSKSQAFADVTPGPPVSAVPVSLSPEPMRTHIPGSTLVAILGGTTVSVSLVAQLSSATANMGDVVAIVVAKEVDGNGFIIIPKGSNGQATVTAVEHAGGNGHGGKLSVSFDWIFGSDGEKIKLTNVAAGGDEANNKGAASTATIVSYVLLGPLGLFAHNFVRGKDAVIPIDKVFNMFVDHDVHIDATQKSTAPPGFAN